MEQIYGAVVRSVWRQGLSTVFTKNQFKFMILTGNTTQISLFWWVLKSRDPSRDSRAETMGMAIVTPANNGSSGPVDVRVMLF